jgi:hypothetical protein
MNLFKAPNITPFEFSAVNFRLIGDIAFPPWLGFDQGETFCRISLWCQYGDGLIRCASGKDTLLSKVFGDSDKFLDFFQSENPFNTKFLILWIVTPVNSCTECVGRDI